MRENPKKKFDVDELKLSFNNIANKNLHRSLNLIDGFQTFFYLQE